MKKIAEIIITILISSVVTFLIGLMTGFLRQPDGMITIGPVSKIGDSLFIMLDVSNFNSVPLNDLRISVPKGVELEAVLSSYPLEISEYKGRKPEFPNRRLVISHIEGGKTIRLFIPLSIYHDAEYVNLLNAEEKNLQVIQFGDRITSSTDIIYRSLINTGIYAVIIAIASFFLFTRIEEMQKKAIAQVEEMRKNWDKSDSEMQKQIEKLESETSINQNEMRLLTKKVQKIKLLYLARLQDYNKELNFWRDVIRRLIISEFGSAMGKMKSDELINVITTSLKTYSTLEKASYEYDTIKVLAGILKDDTQDS